MGTGDGISRSVLPEFGGRASQDPIMHGGGGSISGLLPSPSSSVYTTLRFTYTELTCVYLTRGLVLSRFNVPAGTGLVWFQRVLGRGKLGIHKSVWYTQLSDLRIPKSAKYTQTGELRIPSSVRYTQLGDSRIPELLGIHKRENCVYPRRRPEAAGRILASLFCSPDAVRRARTAYRSRERFRRLKRFQYVSSSFSPGVASRPTRY